MDRPRVAFVVQRYGEEVNGGAETLCRGIAEHMSHDWDIEVLTSRACEYVSRFENDYPEGCTHAGPVRVHRFTIDRLRSDPVVFSALDRKVLQRASTPAEEEAWLKEIGPECNGLSDYLRLHERDLDLVVFFTYLYATTTQMLRIVRDKAILVPCAHDEPPIYARPFDTLFQVPRILLCNTVEEESFLRRRTAGLMAPSSVVGIGVNIPTAVDSELFRHKHGIGPDYIVSVGRIQREKGSDKLFEYYLSLPLLMRQRHPLVLLGKAAMEVPVSPYIHHVGFVSESEKQSALAGAALLVAPSQFESLSLVLLESWAAGTPVLVNGNCDVLKKQVQRANGGLWYDNAEEFREALSFLLDRHNAPLRELLAENGKAYVRARYEWTIITEQYRAAFRGLQEGNSPTGREQGS